VSDQLPAVRESLTAQRIVQAATELFMQRGYRAVAISDIITAAQVTKPTLYYYFRDKQELFVQMGLQTLDELGSRLSDALSAPLAFDQRLALMAAALIDSRHGDMRMMRHEMAEHLTPPQQQQLGEAFYRKLFAPLTALMAEGLQFGRLQPGRPPAMIATLFLSLCEAFTEMAPQGPLMRMAAAAGRPSQLPEPDAAQLVLFFLSGAGLSGAAAESSAAAGSFTKDASDHA
jgi:TetR/AcrR family transcriptional regulator